MTILFKIIFWFSAVMAYGTIIGLGIFELLKPELAKMLRGASIEINEEFYKNKIIFYRPWFTLLTGAVLIALPILSGPAGDVGFTAWVIGSVGMLVCMFLSLKLYYFPVWFKHY